MLRRGLRENTMTQVEHICAAAELAAQEADGI
jgi:hypothetical protein